MEVENEELVIELVVNPPQVVEVEMIVNTEISEDLEELKEDLGTIDTDYLNIYNLSK